MRRAGILLVLAAAALAGCAQPTGISGRWAEVGQCAVDRWNLVDGVVYRTNPGVVRQNFNQVRSEVSVVWGTYTVQEDDTVLLTRPAPGARETVLLWFPRVDAEGVVTGFSMEIREPGGQRRRAEAERCPSP